MSNQFAWVIEAPGPRYLAVQKLTMSHHFQWSLDHAVAIRFHTEAQADAVMMALRDILPKTFEFEPLLGNAKPVEHGWLEKVNKATHAATRASGFSEAEKVE